MVLTLQRIARRPRHGPFLVFPALVAVIYSNLLTRALRARPPEVPEKAPYLAALQPRAQGKGDHNIHYTGAVCGCS